MHMAGHDEDGAGLPCVHLEMAEHGRAWQRQLGGKSQCRACCVISAAFALCGGNPKLGLSAFHLPGSPNLPSKLI